jgi:hypothetical protein
LIWDAELIWNGSHPFSINDYKYHDVYEYLKQRCVFDLASTCDQLRTCNDHRYLKMRSSGSVLVGRVWHVRKGFIGVHATRCWYNCGMDLPYERDERRTLGACQGGGVWFGTVTPDTVLVVGEGIETTLSAMMLWGAKAGVATLGTEGLKSLVLPSAARKVVIAADNDEPQFHKVTGKKLPDGMNAAKATRRLWLEEDPNIDVEIKMAPGPAPRDWNDVLMEQRHV